MRQARSGVEGTFCAYRTINQTLKHGKQENDYPSKKGNIRPESRHESNHKSVFYEYSSARGTGIGSTFSADTNPLFRYIPRKPFVNRALSTTCQPALFDGGWMVHLAHESSRTNSKLPCLFWERHLESIPQEGPFKLLPAPRNKPKDKPRSSNK